MLSQSDRMGTKWSGSHTFVLVGIIAAIMLIGLKAPCQQRLWAWLSTMGLMVLFAMIAGHGVTGLWRGLLIDAHNKMSLSRLQMTFWTIIVLSGFLTAALSNLATGQINPLAIAIPDELWLLMGISTTTLVGSPLIASVKKNKEAKDEEKDQVLALVAKQKGVKRDEVENKGQVVCYLRSEIAQWSDMFKGEEVGNAAQLDLAKIQMFYFTLVLVLVYAVALGKIFACDANLIDAFPKLDASIISLLSISHAGYLTNKAIPHSATK